MDKSKLTFLGVIITIGIIFGDIGTSVLYVMKSFVNNTDAMMSENLVLGFVSLIFLGDDLTDNNKICNDCTKSGQQR